MNENILFAYTSANLYNFLSETSDPGSAVDHLKAFKEIVNSGFRAHKDIFSERINDLQVMDHSGLSPEEKSQGVIYISFHTGSCNLLYIYLTVKELRDTMVLADNGSMVDETYCKMDAYFKSKYGHENSLKMINVQERKSIFKIRRALKDGYSVVAFIDGNKGTDGLSRDNLNLTKLSFLNGTVMVRKGLPLLSYMTQAPIVLGLNYEMDNVPYLKLYPAIRPESTERKEDFCKRTLTRLFCDFEDHVRMYTTQWAIWPYIHNWTVLDGFVDLRKSTKFKEQLDIYGKQLKVNYARYCPLKVSGNNVLFDRTKYSIISLENKPKLVNLFSTQVSQFEKNNILKSMVTNSPSIVKELIYNEILY